MLRFALIIGLSICLVFGIPSPVEIEDDYEYDQGETLCLTSKVGLTKTSKMQTSTS